jgi:hypothetical protein
MPEIRLGAETPMRVVDSQRGAKRAACVGSQGRCHIYLPDVLYYLGE